MKEATGELSMTVIVIIGAIIVVGILYAFKKPLGDWIGQKWKAVDTTQADTDIDTGFGD